MLLPAVCMISLPYVNSNWSYSPETAKLGVDLCDLDLWPLTLTFCMNITSVHGNNSWKYHDDTMMGTWWKRCDGRTDRQTDGRTDGLNQSYSCLVTAKNLSNVMQSKNKANLRDLIAVTGLVISNWNQIVNFFSLCDHEIWWMTSKNNKPRPFAWTSLSQPIKLVNIIFHSMPCIHAEWVILNDDVPSLWTCCAASHKINRFFFLIPPQAPILSMISFCIKMWK